MQKKHITFMAACLLALTSCQDRFVPEANRPSEEIFDYPVDVTFHAVNPPALKTVLNYETILWESDDAIKVLWGENKYNKALAKPFNSNQKADFETTVEDAESYYGVYPYTAASSLSDGCLTLSVPSSQTGDFRDANLAVAMSDENNMMTFRHVVGYIEFTIDMTGIVEISGGASDNLAGTVRVTGFDQSGKPEYEVTGSSSTIKVDVKTSGTYYLAVLPDARLDYLYITLTEGGKTQYIYANTTKQFYPGKLLALGNITERFSTKRPMGATLESFTITEFKFDDNNINF